ncbi:helix-turn-helix domain-containing protein [Ferrimicrobium sp.]|jgi:excisionase family DNA binding protein|uniref:Helix-turn-helix domain-containing protein n=1 Tax=Ferrimicrobium acidiphilum TaxID=121039 RepID=A0ABV3XYN5_9ACTN|nr:helix-turn-helix domain-containing protein [Ferrimicrobium sp.]
MPENRTALFVRIPVSRARQLDSRAHALGRTKQDLVNDLLESALVPGEVSAAEDGPRDTPDEVLTLAELAELLKLDDDAVLVRVHSGELPGRRFGSEWRFSRRAVLDWLDGHDAPERRPPGFAGSPSHIVGHSAEGV